MKFVTKKATSYRLVCFREARLKSNRHRLGCRQRNLGQFVHRFRPKCSLKLLSTSWEIFFFTINLTFNNSFVYCGGNQREKSVMLRNLRSRENMENQIYRCNRLLVRRKQITSALPFLFNVRWGWVRQNSLFLARLQQLKLSRIQKLVKVKFAGRFSQRSFC